MWRPRHIWTSSRGIQRPEAFIARVDQPLSSEVFPQTWQDAFRRHSSRTSPQPGRRNHTRTSLQDTHIDATNIIIHIPCLSKTADVQTSDQVFLNLTSLYLTISSLSKSPSSSLRGSHRHPLSALRVFFARQIFASSLQRSSYAGGFHL